MLASFLFCIFVAPKMKNWDIINLKKTNDKEELMHRAIELSKNSVKTGERRAVIAKDGIIIAEAPTA